MTRFPLFIFFSLIMVVACGSVPESRRSRAVIKRIKPKLEKELIAKGLQFGSPVYMRIFKASKELEIWIRKDSEFVLFKIYQIHYFSGTPGPKLKEGDRQAPEGFYFVTPKRMNPNSRYHLAFNLGYPNKYDQVHGRTGSALMVHGNTGSVGCFAMTDTRIEEIYTLADGALRGGQKFFRVHSFPFRMTEKNMVQQKGRAWYNFWVNLKEGYDLFEKTKVPPNVTVVNKRYVFEAK